VVWLHISIERKWFATSHGSFLDDKANPMIIVDDPNSSSSIYKSLSISFGRLVPEFQRLRIVKFFMLQEPS